MSPRIRVCTDRLDTPAVRWLLGRTDVGAGRVVLHPSGHHVDKGGPQLMEELLDAMGVTGTQRRVGRAHENVQSHVLPWLLAYDLRELLVHGHTRVPRAAFGLLLDVVDAAGLRLWLTGPPGGEKRRELLDGRGAAPATWEDVRTVFSAGAEAAPPDRRDSPTGWPAMPADDFPTFRAAMRAALTPEQFAAADALYLGTVAEARGRLRPLLTGPDLRAETQPAGGRPLLDRDRLEAAVAAYLHTLIGRSATAPELTVRIRAAQAAAFHLGWLLQVNLERLVTTASTPSAGAVRNPQTWQTLRLFREPYVGSLLALAALGCDIETMLGLPAAAVAADGGAVTVHGAALPAPPGAEVLLRAQLYAGQLEGRRPNQPFLHVNGAPLTHPRVIAAVRAAYLDTGIPLLSRLVDHTWSGHEWFNRWGVCLQEIS